MGATRTQIVWRVLAADGVARHPHRRDAGRRPRRRRDGPAAVHRPVQRLLARPRRNLMEPTPSLAVLIYDFSSLPFPNQIEIAWAASLVLVSLVLVANLVGQSCSRGASSTNRESCMSMNVTHDPRPMPRRRDGQRPTTSSSTATSSELYYGSLQGRARHADSDPEEHRSRPSSARPAAARARCCAASTA